MALTCLLTIAEQSKARSRRGRASFSRGRRSVRSR